jgi:Cu/Ag efflux pump CusA
VVELIRELVALSLRFRVLVIGVIVAVMGVGVAELRHASVDTLPEFAPPHVQVRAEALGLSAAEVEQLITVPLEQDLLNGVPWLRDISSESVPGLSSIDLVFDPGTNVLHARQMVQEHLTQAHALPQVGSPPVMVQPTSTTSRVLMIGLDAEDVSLIDLSVLARWKIKPRLMGVPGVANVAIWGQRDRQLQVQVDPARLRKFGVTLNQVVDTTGNALWVSPLTFVEASTPGTGGFIDTAAQRLAIQHVFPITTAEGLSGVSIEDTGGRRLLLGQVADVVEDHQPLIGDAGLRSGPGLMLVVEKFPNADTKQVTKAVEEALAEMKPGLAGISVDTKIYRPATFIDRALHDLGWWALFGLVLLILVLGAFTASLRAAAVATLSISLALIAAAWVLYLRGTSFNVMILAGLVVAIGVCIDDAIADLDGMLARLRAQRASGTRTPVQQVVTEVSSAVRRPLFYGTLIAVLVPLPVLALTGVGGAFARAVLVSYVLAVAASTLVAVTATPALAALLMGPGRIKPAEPVAVRLLQRGFDRVGPGFFGHPRRAYLTVAVLALAALAVIPQLGARATLPAFEDRGVLVQWRTAPGTSLTEMARITDIASRELRSLPGVRNVGSHVGRAILSDQIGNVNSAETWLTLAPSADYGATLDAVKHLVRQYPGIRSSVQTYPQARVREIESREPSDFVVRVYGTDLTVLRNSAADVQRMLSGVHGLVGPQVEGVAEEPAVNVKVNLLAAQRYGIKPGDVRRSAATFFAGLPVGSLYEESKIFDVVVWGAPSVRYTPENVGNLMVDVPGGGAVKLADIASIKIGPAATVIRHDDIFRSLDVTARVNGRDASAVTREVRARLRTLAMPLEYHAEVLDNLSDRASERNRVLALGVAVLIVIFLLLQSAFGSWRLASVLFLTLPLALVGGVLAAWFVGGVRTLGAMLGLLTVLTIAARNGVLALSAYQRRAQQDGELFVPAATVFAMTRARVASVALTAIATAAVFAPLIVLGRIPGTEVFYPMALVVIGGLLSSTLVTLFILPALYLRFRSRSAHVHRRARPITALVTVLLLGTVLGGCSATSVSETEAAPPATLLPIGDKGVSQVVLTADAARRAGIETEKVRREGAHGLALPLAAVLYDKDGLTWVYTTTKELTFVRTRVAIARVSGDVAILTAGPPVDTEVVTVGAAELLGSEYTVSGE